MSWQAYTSRHGHWNAQEMAHIYQTQNHAMHVVVNVLKETYQTQKTSLSIALSLSLFSLSLSLSLSSAIRCPSKDIYTHIMYIYIYSHKYEYTYVHICTEKYQAPYRVGRRPSDIRRYDINKHTSRLKVKEKHFWPQWTSSTFRNRQVTYLKSKERNSGVTTRCSLCSEPVLLINKQIRLAELVGHQQLCFSSEFQVWKKGWTISSEVGGFNSTSMKNMCENGFVFPKFRGEQK